MINQNDIQLLVSIPVGEKNAFQKMIRDLRGEYIRSPQNTVDQIFDNSLDLIQAVTTNHNISAVILELRESAYHLFLEDEAKFNFAVLKEISNKLDTPKSILEAILAKSDILNMPQNQLIEEIKSVCGEYAGRISPYLYQLALSNTQSRRSRAGKTFEQIIYKIYRTFDFEYQSQSQIGKSQFKAQGLGKIVDSLLPNIASFEKRRDKVIIGTMKTTLRERWQEVIEEISRTSLPSIYLLTIDDDISANKADQMSKHNVVLVVPLYVKQQQHLQSKDNIISFESYFLEEIPEKMRFWNK
jgi:EcoRII C terminal